MSHPKARGNTPKIDMSISKAGCFPKKSLAKPFFWTGCPETGGRMLRIFRAGCPIGTFKMGKKWGAGCHCAVSRHKKNHLVSGPFTLRFMRSGW